MSKRFSSREAGTASIAASLILLFTDHLLGHGMDLNPVNHWLSEYVLSASLPAIWVMRLAFLALAGCAMSVSVTAQKLNTRTAFALSAAGLAAMPFFSTAPNDGRSVAFSWPMTAANLHQVALYVAIGASLAGMAMDAVTLRDRFRVTMFGVATLATVIQTLLVIVSVAHKRPTVFGGLTERIVVLAMLAWAASFLLSRDRQDRTQGSNACEDGQTHHAEYGREESRHRAESTG